MQQVIAMQAEFEAAENNGTILMMMPSDFVTLSKSLTEYLQEHAAKKP